MKAAAPLTLIKVGCPSGRGGAAARRVGGRGWVAAEPLFGLREDAADLIQLTSAGEFTAGPPSTLDGLRDLAELLHHRDPSPVLVETVGAESELDVPSGLLSCGQTEVGHRCGQLSALPWGGLPSQCLGPLSPAPVQGTVGAHHTGDETGLVGQHLRPGRPILRV